METIQEKFSNIEKENKEMVTNMIMRLIVEQTNFIDAQQDYFKKVLKLKSKIPVIATTFNNKLNQISHIFMERGISLYATINKKTNEVQDSIIGQAILVDLLNYTTDGDEKLKQINQIQEDITQDNVEHIHSSLTRANRLKSIAVVIKSIITHTNPVEFKMKKEHKRKMKSIYEEYMELNEQIWKYELKDHLEQAVIQYISKSNVPNILELLEIIKQELTQLGYENIMPKIGEAVSKQYEKEKSGQIKPILERLKVDIQNPIVNVKEMHEQSESPKMNYKNEVR